MSGGFASSGFEIGNVLDRRAYPTARRNRTGPPASGLAVDDPAAALPTPPQTRNINFLIAVNANTRSTISRGPLRGPALVRSLEIQPAGGAALDNWFCNVGYSATPITESLVAPATAYTWEVFWEPTPHSGTDLSAGTRGALVGRALTNIIPHTWDVRGVVPLTEWYLVITVGQTAGAAANQWAGYVNVLERVSREALALYAG